MPLPTTRYERRKYRAKRFARRAFKRKQKMHECGKDANGKTIHVGKYPVVPLGPLQSLLTEHPERNVASFPPSFPFFPWPWAQGDTANGDTPWVRIDNAAYLAARAAGKHQHFALLHYHVRRCHRVPTHVKPYRRSARDRKITGANWLVFRTGYFPDWDILNRHPNETDFQNGLPPYPHPWPIPLGY